MKKKTKKSIKKINHPKETIIKIGCILYDKGLIAGADGNISIKTGEKTMLTTCSGIHKGLMGPEDITEVCFSQALLAPSSATEGCRPSTEALMHVLIYETAPEAGAVIHAHCPYATALSMKADNWLDLSLLTEGRLLFGKIPVVPDLPPGTKELARQVAQHFPAHKAVIMKAHGAVAAGRDLKEALCLIEALEHNCRILALSRMLERD
jgi:L-fuculose-phosphate aldolase